MLTKYFNGIEMLEDVSNNKIHIIEKILYLAFIFSSLEDVFFGKLPVSNDDLSYFDQLGEVMGVMGLLVIAYLSRQNMKMELLETYSCLFVSATTACYVILIPAWLLLELLLALIFDFKLSSAAFDLAIVCFFHFHMVVSMLVWTKRQGVKEKICSG